MALCVKLFMIISLIISKKSVAASEVETIDQKTLELENMLQDNYALPIVDINFFKKYVLSPKKKYSFVVFFMVTQNCPMCEDAYDEFMIVAKSHIMSKDPYRLFFGIVDYHQSPKIFDLMRLSSAPYLTVFLANGNTKVNLDDTMGEKAFHAENIAFFIEKRIHVRIAVERSFFLANILGWGLMLAPIVYFFYKQDRDNLIKFAHGTDIWAMLAVVYCGLITSGQIYNHILKPPLMSMFSNDGDGSVTYQIESFAAAILIILISIGMIVMIEARGGVEKIKCRRNNPACMVGLSTVLFCFFLYAHMLKWKLYNEYPYTVI